MSNIENNISKVNPNPSSHKRASNQPNYNSNPVKNIDSIDINRNMSKQTLVQMPDTGTASGYITNDNLLKILDDSIAQLEKERDKLENSFKNMDLTKEEQEYYTKKYPNLIINPFTGEIYSPRDAENVTSPGYYGAGWQNTIDKEAYTKDYNAFLREYLHIQTNYDEMIAMYNQDILTLQSSRYSLEQQVKEQPYIDLQQTADYIQYINEIGDVDSKINEIDEELVRQHNTLADGNADLISSSIPQLQYMTQEDKGVYCYLYDKKGREAAEQYLVDIADKLNKAEGFANSADFLESIAKKDGNGNVITDADGKIIIDESLLTDAKVAFKGFLDGVDNFGEGLDNVFFSNGIMSSNQYTQTFILEALYNCGEESKLPGIYNFNSSLGNIAIPTLAAILFSTVYPPAGATLFTLGATEVTAAGIYGYSLTGLSIYGNAKNTAYMSGASFWTAQGYGICNALSEMGLGLFLGNLPFLNGGAKLALIDLLKEGIEEYIQEYVSAGWNSIFLKQPTEDLATLDENARKSFLYGLIMSGLLNGVTTTTVKIADQLVIISIDKVAEYMNKHTGATFVEAIEKTSNVKMFEPNAAAPVDNGVNNPNNGFYPAGDLTNPNHWVYPAGDLTNPNNGFYPAGDLTNPYNAFHPAGDLDNSTPGINGSPIKALPVDDIIKRINSGSGNLTTVDFSYLSSLTCENLYTVFDSISDQALTEMLKNKTVIAACDTVIRNTDKSNPIMGTLLGIISRYTPSGRLYVNGTTQTGANQGAVAKVFDTNTEDISLQDELVKQVQQQYSRMSRDDAIDFLKTMEGKPGSRGICPYADLANIIFEHFSRMANPEQAFENKFGFPMYWNGELNDAQLITDMMLKISGDNLIFKNSGFDWFKSRFRSAENNDNYVNPNHNVEEFQTYEFEIINEYLSNYGLILTQERSGIETTHFSNFDINDFNGGIVDFSAYTDVDLTNILKSYLNGNNYIYAYTNVDTQIVLDNKTRLDLKEGSIIKCTGYNATNDSVNILYEGRPYTVKISDLKNSTLRAGKVYTHNPGDTQATIQQIGLGLLNNKHVSITSMPGLKMVNQATSETMILPGGHVMTVIGIDSNERIIVDSWGGPWYIDISDAANSGNFFKMDITDINDVVPSAPR